jgi:heparan-sulfate lyase
MQKNPQRTSILCFLALAVGIEGAPPAFAVERFAGLEFQVRHPDKKQQSKVLPQRLAVPEGMAYVLDVWIDPVVRPEGNMQVDAGFAFGLDSALAEPDPYLDKGPKIAVSVREASERGFWSLFIDGVNVSKTPTDKGNHDNREFQQPFVFAARPDAYRLRIVGIPEADQTRLRFYFEDLFRPVEEHLVPRQVRPEHVGFYASLGGQEEATETVGFGGLEFRPLTVEQATREPESAEAVMATLNLDHPALAEVKRHRNQGDRTKARSAFIRHMRERATPPGAPLDSELLYARNYREIADQALQGRYGTEGFFAAFSDQFVDPDGTICWERDNGHLNRHFHWCSLAKAYLETGDPRYAARFSEEVSSWVRNEPFFQPQSRYVSGVDLMDGTVFRVGWMNTSNIGRRCELTWWPAYEVFRKSPEFTDEAHFDMLLGFLRQARLLTNPTSFAWWDDGGAHGTMALLQTALMLPEFKESKRWREIADQRLQIVMDRQFYPDGSHVSLSTGYNFASIKALENAVNLYHRCGLEPEAILEPLERAYRHPMLIARPNRGQVDLNDGGWGTVDDHLRLGAELFPKDEMLRWFATSGAEGAPTERGSVYFPNAGHFAMRTGWGPEHRYLFMDAGPVGASHGKEDKLGIILDIGGNLLLTNGGRAAYSDAVGLRYTGSIHAQNTVVVDDLNQARIAHRAEIYGWEPEPRRWLTNEAFDYAEGFYTHGWWGTDKSVRGKHTRQVLCVKGLRSPDTTYFVVFDTLEFADDKEHTCEALWHSARNETEILADGLTVESWDAGGAVRIVSLARSGLDTRLVTGQTEPHWQGWTVYGEHKKPVPTVIHRWRAQNRSTRAWLLVPALQRGQWCVDDVERIGDEPANELLRILVRRSDGGRDYILRRPPGRALPEVDIGPSSTQQDMAVVCVGEDGEVEAELTAGVGDLR